ncbi:dihydroorotase [Coprobacter sp.]
MKKILIRNATVINDGCSEMASVLIEGDKIAEVYSGECSSQIENKADKIVEAFGKWLIPGVIDDQVHFREPGLTHKADIHSESVAAVAGGVTSYMEMPNTNPQTTTKEALDWKFNRAAETSVANYSFYMGATNDNIRELHQIDYSRVCGVKLFMGSSTGNMLVDQPVALKKIFAEIPALIAVHCEKEEIIRSNREYYVSRFGEELPIQFHPLIRSAEACYASSSQAVDLAVRYNARLHLLHLSTARELSLLEDRPLSEKRVTGEVCVHHLFFDDNDYAGYGNKIKWNPAIKTCADRLALTEAVRTNRIDVVATDHAPHLWSEKLGSCLKAASGGPLVQHSLLVMLDKVVKGDFTLEQVVRKMCHAPAELFRIEKRGYIRPGYFADLVLIDPNRRYMVTEENNFSKCGWSPFLGYTFPVTVEKTYVNGMLVYDKGVVDVTYRGRELSFGN